MGFQSNVTPQGGACVEKFVGIRTQGIPESAQNDVSADFNAGSSGAKTGLLHCLSWSTQLNQPDYKCRTEVAGTGVVYSI